MELTKLAWKYPDLWHVTFAGGWTGIRDLGLIPPGELDPAMTAPRVGVESKTVDGTPVQVRNQLHAAQDFTPHLQDVTVEQWWQLINARSYLFCREADMEQMVEAYIAKGHAQEVLKVRTSVALGPVTDRVELTTVNAGVLPRVAKPSRGTATFQPLADFPAANLNKVQEITVVGRWALPWPAVTSVIERGTDGSRRRLFP